MFYSKISFWDPKTQNSGSTTILSGIHQVPDPTIFRPSLGHSQEGTPAEQTW